MKRIISYVFAGLIMTGCNDFLDLKPIDFPTEETFYNDVKGLEGAVIGVYDELQSSSQYGGNFMTLMEIRGDNVMDDNSGAGGGVRYQIEVFTETPANTNLSDAWSSLYKTIYRCNLVLHNVESVKMTEDKYNEIVGQVSFVRALSYFNLVRLWGKVPLVTEPQTVEDARNNKREEVSVIYNQIIEDLNVAKSLPSEWPDEEKGRVTSYAACALLAKVYLYMENYDKVYGKRLLNYILCIRFFIEVHSIVSASRFFHMPTYLRVVIECQSRFFPFFPAFSRNCPDYFLHTSGSSSFRSLSDLGAR